MHRILGRAALLLLISLFPLSARAQDPAGTALATDLTRPDIAQAPLTSSALAALQGKQVVFVGGYLNEGFRAHYFDDATAVMKDLGVATSLVFPPSHESVTDDSDLVVREVEAKFQATGKPVVLVGHSKGGADVLLAVIRHPELVRSGMVDRVVSIQGAVGGSPVATQLSKIPDWIRDKVPGLSCLDFPGLESIAGSEKTVFDGELAKLSPADRALLSSRVFYVRGAVKDKHSTALELRLTHRLLDADGANDGLVLAKDQFGNPASSGTVNFQVVSTPGSTALSTASTIGTLSPVGGAVQTGANSLVTAPLTLAKLPGTTTVSAAIAGGPGSPILFTSSQPRFSHSKDCVTGTWRTST